MKSTGYVYQIRNLVTGECYIGQTAQMPQERLFVHLSGGAYSSRLVYEASLEYGAEALKLELLECGIEADRLDQAEIHSIASFNTLYPYGYNLKTGGKGGGRNCQETRRKMSESHKSKTLSEGHRRKIGDAQRGEKHYNYGKSPSKETRSKISEALKGEKNPNYGKSPSEETRSKMGNAQRGEKNHNYGKSPSEKTRRKMSKAQRRRWAKSK